jgi:hypothetical protein
MIDMRIKSLFFDRPKVILATDRATRRNLSKAGAFIRQAAKTSIRPRRGTSPPGSPPFSHEGSLRRLILFGYEPTTKTVVVGPVRFKRGEAPPLLEFGGSARRRRRARKTGKEQTYTARYQPRPFMGPALQKELPKLPDLWARSVRPET